MGGSWSMAQKRETKGINTHLSVILADDLIHKAIYWKLSIVCLPSFLQTQLWTKSSLIGLRGRRRLRQFASNYVCAYMWNRNSRCRSSPNKPTRRLHRPFCLFPSAKSPFKMRLKWCKFYANSFNSSFLIVCEIFIGFFIVVSTFQLRTHFFFWTSFQLIINSFRSFYSRIGGRKNGWWESKRSLHLSRFIV